VGEREDLDSDTGGMQSIDAATAKEVGLEESIADEDGGEGEEFEPLAEEDKDDLEDYDNIDVDSQAMEVDEGINNLKEPAPSRALTSKKGKEVCPVETDRPSGPYRLHGPSRSGASYMLQIILRTNRTVMDCWTLPYTLSLYGHMLIIAIIVLILLMSIVLNFYCSLLDANCCMIGLLTVPLMALSPTAPIVSKHLVMFT